MKSNVPNIFQLADLVSLYLKCIKDIKCFDWYSHKFSEKASEKIGNICIF